jgi:hypothetical protein
MINLSSTTLHTVKMGEITDVYVRCPHLSIEALRVPGGWIYYHHQTGMEINSCFVPFSEEGKHD